MKYDGKIEISWKAASGDIEARAQGCEVDMIDALAKSTVAILKDSSLCGLRNKALLNMYIAFLIELHEKHPADESSCIKIPMSAFRAGIEYSEAHHDK